MLVKFKGYSPTGYRALHNKYSGIVPDFMPCMVGTVVDVPVEYMPWYSLIKCKAPDYMELQETVLEAAARNLIRRK